MTRTMLRDALSALAAVTLVSAATGAPASAQGKSIRAYQAEVSIDAVRGLKPKAQKRALWVSGRTLCRSQGRPHGKRRTGKTGAGFRTMAGGNIPSPRCKKSCRYRTISSK